MGFNQRWKSDAFKYFRSDPPRIKLAAWVTLCLTCIINNFFRSVAIVIISASVMTASPPTDVLLRLLRKLL